MKRDKKTEAVLGGLFLTLVTAGSLCLAQTPPAALSAGLQEKMRKLQRTMESRGKEGLPPIRVMLTMQGFEPLLKEGKMKEAEEVVDRALKLSEQAPGDDPLERKLSRVKKAMEKRAKSDVPPIRIALAMKRFESALKAGKAEQAESALDAAIKRLGSAPGEDPLEKKMLRAQKGVKELESKGGDPRLIGMVMSKLDPAIQAGDESQAEAALDAALQLLKSKDPRSEPEAAPYVRLLDKMSEAQEQAARWTSAGGDGSTLAPLGERAGQAMKEGKLNEAEKAFDEILDLVRQEPGPRKL